MHHRIILAALLALPGGGAMAQEAVGWPVLEPRFESTGGGGVVIDGYRPVVIGDRCVTRFTATTPAGEVFANYAVFEAMPLAGGTLCRAGRWGAVEGGATGITPLVVWLKDGIMRRAPADRPRGDRPRGVDRAGRAWCADRNRTTGKPPCHSHRTA